MERKPLPSNIEKHLRNEKYNSDKLDALGVKKDMGKLQRYLLLDELF